MRDHLFLNLAPTGLQARAFGMMTIIHETRMVTTCNMAPLTRTVFKPVKLMDQTQGS
jgi:hypothetical protein